MTSVEKLRNVREVLFHSNCPDGTASAMICRIALGPNVNFWSVQYGTDLLKNLEPREGQLFVDITPPIQRWEEWKDFSPIVLDHHETSRHITEGLNGVYGLNETHSGAMLAYENVFIPLINPREAFEAPHEHFEPSQWKDFAELAMIRDTWKKDHSKWKEACAQAMALQFHGSHKLINMVSEGFPFKEFQEFGLALLDQTERKTKLIAKSAYHKPVQTNNGELKISFFNCTEKIISDIGNLLIEEGTDVAIGYFHMFEDGAMKITVSIRTNEKVSASAIAKCYGGGGHERAAGFRLDMIPTMDQLTEKIITAINLQ